MADCLECRAALPPGARFCPACGAATTSEHHARRKVVTALFCDVAGSTALGERLDPEVLRAVMYRYFEVVTAIVDRYGGTIEKFIGDAVMAVFGVPRAHEDDALRAVRAAHEIQLEVPGRAEEIGEQLALRIGVNTGLVIAEATQHLAFGDALNVAARLQSAARPGEVLLGEETAALVRDAVTLEPLEPLALKGKSDGVLAFRLVAVDAPPGASSPRPGESRLVGRDRELAILRDAWERVRETGGGHLFTLVGEPGVGKSRLVAEFEARLSDDALFLSGRCLPYGDAITFWPLIAALSEVSAAADATVALLEGRGAGTPTALFRAVRDVLETLALERPLVLHVDDVQWAEPMLLDLLDDIASGARDAPILLLCSGRPEFIEHRPGWGGGRLNATSCLLGPLRESDALQILEQHAGLEESRDEVIAAAQGNPLFLHEMAALAAAGGGGVVVPPTIRALLTARLDGLAPDEADVLAHAAIEGEVFHAHALEQLRDSPPDTALDALSRKELIRPLLGGGPGAYRFSHLLLRDAAYDAVPVGRRADLHARYGTWLARSGLDRTEREEIAGWHLERSVTCARELNVAPAAHVAPQAAALLFAAGRRASERWDVVAARALLGRALALAEADDVQHATIALELADQLTHSGDFAAADRLIAGAERVAAVASRARLSRLELQLEQGSRSGTETLEAIEQELSELAADYAEERDEVALAKTHMLGFWVHWNRLQSVPAAAEAKRAAEHAERAGSEQLRQWALIWYLMALADGALHVDELRRAVDAAERDWGAALAPLEVVRGEIARRDARFDDARAEFEGAARRFEELGQRLVVASCLLLLAQVLADRGDSDAAIATARESDALLEALGERALRSTAQAEIAGLAQSRGESEAARAAISLSEELGQPDDLINEIILGSVRAHLALADGDVATATRLAGDASALATATDVPLARRYAAIASISTLRECGAHADALSEAQSLAGLAEALGDRVMAARAEALLGELEN